MNSITNAYLRVSIIALLSVIPAILHSQIKVFDNGNVGVKYTTSTPASKFVYNGPGDSSCDVFLYSGNRSSSGSTQKSVIATGTGSSNHIYGIVGQAETGSGNFLYGVRGGVWSASPISSGRAYGVYGLASNVTSGYNYGVYGYLYGSNNGTAVFGTTTGDVAISGKYAGYFNGDVYITGLMSTNTLTVRSSDQKFKEKIVLLNASEAYDRINLLKPSTYYLRQQEIASADSSRVRYLYDPDSEVFTKRKYGFIAQELKDVFPDLVYTLQDGNLGIDYIGLIPVMIQAIQEQRKELEALRKRIEMLESR